MLLAYLDESYSQNWDDYWIAAVVCPGEEVDSLTRALDAVVAQAISRHDLACDVRSELHGHPLFHGRRDWSELRGKARARIGIYREAYEAIAAHNVSVIVRGVNQPRLRERYTSPWHPHKIVLQHVLEDVDRIAESRDEPALVIADEIDGAIEHRRELWEYQRGPTSGYRARTLTHIVDTLHFAPSHASRLVQAADLVAYLYGRISSRTDTDDRAVRANSELWSVLHPRIYNVRCWVP